MKHTLPYVLGAGLLGIAQLATANVVGTDLQNFNATTSGIDFVTVESSETLEVGFFNFGFASNYAINTLPVFEDESATQSRFHANDSLLTNEYNFGVGLFQNFEMGLSIPEIIRQKVDANDIAHGAFKSIGITSVRLGSKLRIFENSRFGVALAGAANFNRIRNNPYLGTGNSPIFNGQIVVDTSLLGWAIAANLGYRWRNSATPRPGSAITPTSDQLISSAAASYLLTSIDTKLILEIFGARPTGDAGSVFLKRQSSSAEAIAALKYDITSQLASYAGAGTELIHGASSPDWRIFAGVNWAIGPKFGPKTEPLEFKADPPPKEETVILHSIQFKFASGNQVVPGSLDVLAKTVEHIKRPPEYKKIIVRGHTDSVGSDQFNLELSQRRASTVRDALIQNFKLDGKRIEAIGMGESTPIADNGNFQGRQQNRRVEIVIYR